ncbi:zf-TFIIB domain-containing protein [Sphingomonas sp. TX0543]|uniref:TFIIB-type zinc ribbon-containing protein n=1 Tax=Sphingomonas sp. TX0543 TaxID=3399682 RepID=UPI003AFA895A
MSERQGIEIDYCPQCRGVWLDRGELDKIIERSVADDGARPLNDRLGIFDDQRGNGDQRSHGGHGEKHGYERGGHGRRKGFLRELFD